MPGTTYEHDAGISMSTKMIDIEHPHLTSIPSLDTLDTGYPVGNLSLPLGLAAGECFEGRLGEVG
jgi:hypothetical protein